MIFFENSIGVEERMKKTGILSLHLLRRFKAAVPEYKVINHECGLPELLDCAYECKQNLNLRNNSDFVTRYYRTNMGQRCMNY